MKINVGIKRHQIVQILVIVSASFACLGYGMHYAWTSPSIPKLVSDETLNISMDEASYFLVFQAVGMLITTPLYSLLIDKIGRKIPSLLTAVPQIIGWLMVGFAESTWLFYLGKFIVGIGDAAIYTAVIIYACEVTEPEVRHTWTNLLVVAAFTGMCLITVLGSQLAITLTAMIGLGISCLTLVLFWWVPESPYYLLMKNRTEDARKALTLLRMGHRVEEELIELKSDVERQMSEDGTWKELFTIASNRKALALSIGLKVLQQFSGIIAFEVYAQYMFEEAHVDVSAATCAIIYTGALLLFTTLGLFLVHRFGRRPLVIFSSLGCATTLAAEAIFFALQRYTTVNTSELYWFPLCGMVVFVMFCASGLSAIPVLYAGEIFSTSIKSKANTVNNIVYAIGILVTPKIFQTLTENFGILAPFCLFSVCCYIGVILVYVFIIETRGKTLEDIQQELKGNKNKRRTFKNGNTRGEKEVTHF